MSGWERIYTPSSIHMDIDGFHEETSLAELDATNTPKIAVVRYVPDLVSDKHGFAIIYIMERLVCGPEEYGPFPFMDKIWLLAAMKPKSAIASFRMDSRGRVYGKFGMPDGQEISDVVSIMLPYYEKWSRFPDQGDWELVCKLCKAEDNVKFLNKEIRHHGIRNQIESMRKQIVNLQSRISSMEDELNEIYEDAADGMNFLEKHGYEVELAKEHEHEGIE